MGKGKGTQTTAKSQNSLQKSIEQALILGTEEGAAGFLPY